MQKAYKAHIIDRNMFMFITKTLKVFYKFYAWEKDT